MLHARLCLPCPGRTEFSASSSPGTRQTCQKSSKTQNVSFQMEEMQIFLIIFYVLKILVFY